MSSERRFQLDLAAIRAPLATTEELGHLLVANLSTPVTEKAICGAGTAGGPAPLVKGDGKLHAATMKGDLAAAAALLAAGADPNERFTEYPHQIDWTPLMVAAREGHVRLAEFLIQSGANVNAWGGKTSSGFGGGTPLSIALSSERLHIVTMLLDAGAGVSIACSADAARRGQAFLSALLARIPAQSDEVNAALHAAAAAGNVEIVQWLLELGAAVDGRILYHGTTALMMAVDLDILRLLLSAGADVNATDREGLTALMFALVGRHPTAVQLLLDRGADPNAKARPDFRLRASLRLSGRWNEQSEEIWPLKLAIHAAPSTVPSLMRAGADVTVEDVEAAARKGRDRVLRHMLPAPTAAALLNAAALCAAAGAGQIKIVQLLLESGLKVDARNREGETALMKTAEGFFDTMKLLIKSGADINAADRQGITTLMRAAASGRLNVVRFLIDNGADVRQADSSGRRALEYLTDGGNTLFDEGASLRALLQYAHGARDE